MKADQTLLLMRRRLLLKAVMFVYSVEVKRLIEQGLGKPSQGNIIYHFDKEQLKNYTDDEISQIFTAH